MSKEQQGSQCGTERTKWESVGDEKSWGPDYLVIERLWTCTLTREPLEGFEKRRCE